MVLLRQEKDLMMRNIWFDSGVNAKQTHRRLLNFLNTWCFKGSHHSAASQGALCGGLSWITAVRSEVDLYPSLCRDVLIFITGWCRVSAIDIIYMFLPCCVFFYRKRLSPQICSTFLIPQNLLLSYTNGQTVHWDSCGVPKNWGGLWPWKHRCRGASWETYCGENLEFYSFTYKSQWQHG